MKQRLLAIAFALVAANASALDIGVKTPAGNVDVHTGNGSVGVGVHTPAGNVGVHVGQTPQTPPTTTPPPIPPTVPPVPPVDDPRRRIVEMLGNFTPAEYQRFKLSCIAILRNEAAFPEAYVTMCRIANSIIEPK